MVMRSVILDVPTRVWPYEFPGSKARHIILKDYLFERQSGSWYLTGLTESETKPDSAASTEAASQPQPMAESDVQDAILATAGSSEAASDAASDAAAEPDTQNLDEPAADSTAADNGAASTAA